MVSYKSFKFIKLFLTLTQLIIEKQALPLALPLKLNSVHSK